MEEIKYIYFEVNHLTGVEETEPTIKNANVLLIKPHTNSSGVWGYTNMTERHGFSEKSFSVVDQYWIDLEKYDGSVSNIKHVDTVLNDLKKLLEIQEASIYLQGKLFGLPSALQHTIFEAVWRIEHGGYDIQEVLAWYNKIEELYNSKKLL